MNLAQVLRFSPPPSWGHMDGLAREIHRSCPFLFGQPLVAFTGAGGKTTALFRLGRDLLEEHDSVFVTTTTHLGQTQLKLADHSFQVLSSEDLAAIQAHPPGGLSVLAGPPVADGRVSGLDPQTLRQLSELATAKGFPLLIEADGSRMRPLKAPAEHEPVVPPFVDTVVCVAGLSALGKRLTSEWVHRPDRFAALSGLAEGDELTPGALVRVLAHPSGGLKGIPPEARRVAMLNQADTPDLAATARRLASELLSSFEAVVVAGQNPTHLPDSEAGWRACEVYEPLAGIVLAAGEARRYGQPKQLLEWKGQPLVRHAVQAGLSGGLSPVILVTGAYAAEVAQAVEGLPVQLIYNPDWQQGLSTSVQAGLRGLPVRIGAALFLLSDQPQVPADLIRQLAETHARTLSPLIAPQYQGRRLNPALFDRVTFPELMALEGDTGGRSLFAEGSPFPVEWVPWDDPSLSFDVDTPSDFERLKGMET